jgi:erythronate-4-phosphate dehydrogenase
MKIVADINIPAVKNAFADFGEVHTYVGRNLTNKDVKDADILLVRSVTKVNADLLNNSKVKFVGTATIGTDHIDNDYLEQNNIGFASAPASNAISAAEYVISTLLVLAKNGGFDLKDKTIGIIGHGNVGSRVVKKLQAFDINCLINDPPLGLHVDVTKADIISLHVPLTKNGKYPTYRLINDIFLDKIRPDTIFINTSRGEAVDEQALLNAQQNKNLTLALDVWQNEPNISEKSLKKTIIATPHIAGYSLDGKLRGTEMLYKAACKYFNQELKWDVQTCLPKNTLESMFFSSSADDMTTIRKAVLACYDVRDDDVNLRLMLKAENRGNYFDLLRKNYPVRREFSQITINLPKDKQLLAKKLQILGFKTN